MNTSPIRSLVSALFFSVFALSAFHHADAQPAPDNFWAYTDRKFPYDREARISRMSGTGIFRLRIDERTGSVTEVAVMQSTGWKHLDQAAAQTLVRWKARVPATRQTVTVPVTFLNAPPR
jgi:TonB family protein